MTPLPPLLTLLLRNMDYQTALAPKFQVWGRHFIYATEKGIYCQLVLLLICWEPKIVWILQNISPKGMESDRRKRKIAIQEFKTAIAAFGFRSPRRSQKRLHCQAPIAWVWLKFNLFVCFIRSSHHSRYLRHDCARQNVHVWDWGWTHHCDLKHSLVAGWETLLNYQFGGGRPRDCQDISCCRLGDEDPPSRWRCPLLSEWGPEELWRNWVGFLL